jgi:hypothetical protein
MTQHNVVRLDEVRLRKQLERLHLEIIVVDEIQRVTYAPTKLTVDGLDVRLVDPGSRREPFSLAEDDMIASLWKRSGGMLGIALKLMLFA